MENYEGPERRRSQCAFHDDMVKHDETVSIELSKATTELRLARWIAAAVFLVTLGSLGALLSVSYYFGMLAQTVKHNSEQIAKIAVILETHRERTE